MPIIYRTGHSLTVQHKESRNAGCCYTVTTWEVRSSRRLPRSVFDGLREAGMLGYGQGFSVSDPVETTEEVPPTLIQEHTGKVLAEGVEDIEAGWPGFDPKPMKRILFVYTVTDSCDSSD